MNTVGSDAIKKNRLDDKAADSILNKADDLAEKFATHTEWAKYGLLASAAIIGVSSLLDAANDYGEHKQTLKQQRIQEHQLQEKNNKQLEDRWIGLASPPQSTAGLVQEMFNMRSGHSNTWGGVRY